MLSRDDVVDLHSGGCSVVVRFPRTDPTELTAPAIALEDLHTQPSADPLAVPSWHAGLFR